MASIADANRLSKDRLVESGGVKELHPMYKTVAAAVIGFGVGAGAATGIYTVAVPASADPSPAAHPTASHYAKIANATPASLPLGPDSISGVVRKVSPAVVKVVATVPQQVSIGASPFFNPFFGSIFGNQMPGPTRTQITTDIGSGFFFNRNGDILTNDHVIQGASQVKVDVPGYSKPLSATVVGSDYASDLAVIKVKLNKPAPTLALGNSNTTPVGAWSIAIGNPYNLSHTVTVGVVSAKGRPLTIGNRHYRNLLQTSAAINPGNSGGPLLNLAGQVVGINTAVEAQGQGIGFAIPTSTVENILPHLMQQATQSRPWIGVYISTDSASLAYQDSLPTAKGVVVDVVEPNSPASKAGLSAGDVITAVNGQRVTTARALANMVKQSKVGRHLRLTVNSNGSSKLIAITVGQRPPNLGQTSSSAPTAG